jgi:hypothetical protein
MLGRVSRSSMVVVPCKLVECEVLDFEDGEIEEDVNETRSDGGFAFV